MAAYTVADVESILGISRSAISRLIHAGFISPARGKHREYRFTFQDLILLRMAQGLSSAKLPPRRIARTLRRLRDQLPHDMPLAGLRITAVGDQVIVREGASRWQADSGQYLLDFEVAPAQNSLNFLTKASEPAPASADHWFALGRSLEDTTLEQAEAAYETALEKDQCHLGSYINLGCLLQSMGRHHDAEHVLRKGIEHCPHEALLHFNLGVVLEDLRRSGEAVDAYETALALDPKFADAHYNVARLHETLGHSKDAVRHYSEYRRLNAEPTD